MEETCQGSRNKPLDLGKYTKDRKAWRKTIHSRMAHIERWEKQRANKPQEYETVETRNFIKIEQFSHAHNAGKRAEPPSDWVSTRKDYITTKNLSSFPAQTARTDQQKLCYGEYSSETHRTCTSCNKSLSRKIFPRHRKRCRPLESPANLPQAKKYKAECTPLI